MATSRNKISPLYNMGRGGIFFCKTAPGTARQKGALSMVNRSKFVSA